MKPRQAIGALLLLAHLNSGASATGDPPAAGTRLMIELDLEEAQLARAPTLQICFTGGEEECSLARSVDLTQGETTLDLPEEGRWRVTADPSQLWPGQATLDLSSREVHRFPFKAAATVSGKIRHDPKWEPSGHFGLAAEAATPRPDEEEGPAFTQQAACTVNEEMVFVCRLPYSEQVDLRLALPGHAAAYRWGTRLAAAGEVDLGDVTFRRGNSLIGLIVNQAGESVQGARVNATPVGLDPDFSTQLKLRRKQRTAESTESGFFQLAGLGGGAYDLAVVHDDYAPFESATPIVLEEGYGELDIGYSELSPKAQVTITVDPPMSLSQVPWRVSISPMREGSSRRKSRSQNVPNTGTLVRSDLAPGTYHLVLFDGAKKPWHQQVFVAEPGETVVAIEISLIQIQGAVTQKGRPISGEVTLASQKLGAAMSFETDEDGIFGGYLTGPGTWSVRFKPSANQETDLFLEPLEIKQPSGKKLQEVEIVVPATTLRGLVSDSSGRAVDSAKVSIAGDSGGLRVATTSSGADGSFELSGLPEGSYLVGAEKHGVGRSRYQAVQLDESLDPWLGLTLAESRLLSGLLETDRGFPVAGARVFAIPAGDPSGSVAHGSTDLSGAFEIEFLSDADSATLLVVAPGYPIALRQEALGQQFIHLVVSPDGGTLSLDLSGLESPAEEMVGVWGHLRGDLSVNGITLPIQLLRVVASTSSAAITTGLLPLGLFEPGNYQVCVGLDPSSRDDLECDNTEVGRFGDHILAPR